MMRLQDERQTKVLLVTLAETTAVLEAAHLQDDLRRAGIEPWAWVIKQSVTEAHPEAALLRQRTHNSGLKLRQSPHHHAQRYAVFPLLKQKPIGVDRLRQLIHPQGAAVARVHLTFASLPHPAGRASSTSPHSFSQVGRRGARFKVPLPSWERDLG